MQSSFHIDEPDFWAADVTGYSPGSARAGASGESLDALKARTTPMDITNPFVTPHASCELAFLATAISIEHRYDEVHMHFPSENVAPGTQSWQTPEAYAINPETLSHPDITLNLIDDSDLARIDLALIELATHQDDVAPAITPLLLTNEMLSDWQTEDSNRAPDWLVPIHVAEWDEGADSMLVWH